MTEPKAGKISSNADGSKTVRLDVPLTGHSGPIIQVTIRPPTYGLFMRLGDPTVLVYGQGSAVPMEAMDVIREYAEALIDTDPLLLEKASLADAMAIRDVIKSFFRTAGEPTI
ncbi:hypothetical protein [Microvirga zambiensis]|uniref:hypothetical protein n=1 Tax=Microvirga zambiensis TaxID=1402137 RepID=UPI00191DAC66|nr:hypothetical protein [Microvirga zambiensis]